MTSSEGQYAGTALKGGILDLSSPLLIEQILAAHGLNGVDEAEWYPLATALSIYRMIGEKVGPRVLHAIGSRIVTSAPYPPGITDIRSVLLSLNDSYHRNVRGPDIGHVACSFDDDRSATATFVTPFPCVLCVGILQGCFKKYQQAALIEHGVDGCVDEGATLCTYRISW